MTTLGNGSTGYHFMCGTLWFPLYVNLFPSGHYLIKSLQLMSAACCTGRYRQTNMFTIIHFVDGKVSEGFYMQVFIA